MYVYFTVIILSQQMWDFGAEANNSVEVTQLVSCSLASESAVPHIQDVDWKGLRGHLV